MERIREAVQRARQQRGPDAPVGITTGARRVFSPVDVDVHGPGEIVYSTTRSIPVPMRDQRANRIVSGFEPCAFTEAYKILSTQVAQKLREHRWNTLAVTSPREGEGKSLTAANLAISLAMEFNQTALLVDTDLRQPSLRRLFGWNPGPGLSDYLIQGTPIEDLLINPGIRGFVVLPGGTPQSNTSEMLGWLKMLHLVEELKARYPSRIVVFDLPPLLTTADVLAFAPHVEAMLLVVEEGVTKREDVARSAELLAATHLIGTVLNKAQNGAMARAGYGVQQRVPRSH
jgi:capsular exopolysaccharide synthesis family protein